MNHPNIFDILFSSTHPNKTGEIHTNTHTKENSREWLTNFLACIYVVCIIYIVHVLFILCVFWIMRRCDMSQYLLCLHCTQNCSEKSSTGREESMKQSYLHIILYDNRGKIHWSTPEKYFPSMCYFLFAYFVLNLIKITPINVDSHQWSGENSWARRKFRSFK